MKRFELVFATSAVKWHLVAVFVTLIGFVLGVGVAARALNARHPKRADVYARATRCDGYVATKAAVAFGMRLRVFAMALACALGFAGGLFFVRRLHRPITTTLRHRPAYHMEWI
jgi:hypothetical protein